MSDDLKIVTVPRDLYYHEVAYVRGLEADNARLRALVKNLADELEPWVEQYYARTKDYPSELRRYERDIAPVKRARAALEPKP